MRTSKKDFWLIPALVAIIVLLGSAAPSQNFEFRLANIERRIDQVQGRIDSVEREQRMQSMSNSSRPEVTREAMIELQRQENSLAEQVVGLEQRMLEIKKAIDRLDSEHTDKKEDARAKPAEAPKRKP